MPFHYWLDDDDDDDDDDDAIPDTNQQQETLDFTFSASAMTPEGEGGITAFVSTLQCQYVLPHNPDRIKDRVTRFSKHKYVEKSWYDFGSERS